MRTSVPSPAALVRHLLTVYHHHRLHTLSPRNCRHAVIWRSLKTLAARSNGLLTLATVGHSLEGRDITLVRCGRGPTRILVWSQMHGDESTGTLALLDICSFLTRRAGIDFWVRDMLERSTLLMVPMLNPDGAEQRRRETAACIDMNRDARALTTPEARMLRRIHDRYSPSFGFNLHDQELSSVGTSMEVAAIALLAPPVDGKGSTPPERARALKVASLIAAGLERAAKGRITRYDDTFEPRAFGESMQRRGTSTVLIESGHWPGDRDKVMIRKLNFVCLLAAWHGVSSGAYKRAAVAQYRRLPPNAKSVYDIVVSNVRVHHPRGWSSTVDVGLQLEPRFNRTGSAPVVTVKGVGDLGTCARLRTVRSNRRRVALRYLAVDRVGSLSKMFRLLGVR